MRTIKFRAWSGNTMIDVHSDNISSNNFEFFFKNKNDLMQFTGLLDKNGKEIYEGDILQHEPDGNMPHHYIVVYWDGVMAAYYVKFQNSNGTDLLEGYTKRHKIIGNIYENPELLKA